MMQRTQTAVPKSAYVTKAQHYTDIQPQMLAVQLLSTFGHADGYSVLCLTAAKHGH